MPDSDFSCGNCQKCIPKHLRVIRCTTCLHYFHVKCTDINQKQFNDLALAKNEWNCNLCIHKLFEEPEFSNPEDNNATLVKKGEKCGECRKTIAKNINPINCDMCNVAFHNKCTGLSYRQSRTCFNWICPKCAIKSLPFAGLDENQTYLTLNSEQGVDINNINLPSFSIQSLLDQMPGQKFDTSDFLSNSIKSKYYSPAEFLRCKLPKNFTMLHINIVSLSKHIDELRNLLKLLKHPFDIIGITETRLLNDETLINIDLDGYDFVHTPTFNRCGGAGFYVKSAYDFEIKKKLSKSIRDLTETIFIEIKRKGQKNIVLGCIYRHHCTITSFMNNYFSDMLTELSKQPNKISILMGDFNVDLAKYNSHTETGEFYDLLSSHAFRPLILQPTRVTSSSATLIDNIFINDMSCHSNGGNITSSVSDHYFQFSQVDIYANEDRKNVTKYGRNYRYFNSREFSEELSKLDWSDVINNNKTDEAYSTFYHKIEHLLDEMAPYHKLTKNEMRLEERPWITRGILVSMKKRDNLYKLLSSEKDQNKKHEIFEIYKQYRNLIVTLLKQSKKNYYSSYFVENQNNIKKTWDGIRGIINVSKRKNSLPTKIIYGNSEKNTNIEMANAFNNFFVDIGKNVEKKIPQPKSSFHVYMGNPNEKSIFLGPCDQQELRTIINALRASKASGPNSIPSNILIEFSDYLIEPLTAIINSSLVEGIFPSLNKEARVCPIYKKDDKLKCENYRPISLLPNLSKIFERVIYNRVEDFLTSTNQFYSLQFGFRKSYSTNHALLSIVEQIRESMDNKRFSCGVFIDLEKAFDTVNHEILIAKLEHYGIRGIAKKWFHSYLTQRSQTVRINGEVSTKRWITCGVPQGSILGPLLFLLYINDMHNSIKKSTMYHFADDTNLLYSCKTLKELRKVMINDLKLLFAWLCSNRLSLNPTKTEFIVFRPPHSSKERIVLSLNGIKLYESTKLKYLGIILDNKLSWNAHMNELAKKLSRSIGLIYKVKQFCSKNVLRSLYFSLFHSHLSYGIAVWGGNITADQLNRLNVFQNRILKIIFLSPNDPPIHANDIRKALNILSVEDQIKLQMSSFMWDYDHNLLPEHLRQSFKRSNLIHNYQTRSAEQGSLFYTKVNTTSFGIKSFKYQGVKILNELLCKDTYIAAKNKKSFIRTLKAELIQKY